LESPGGSGIKDGVVDLVLLHNVLFQSQKKADIIKEAGRVLKTGGTLVLIDWLLTIEAGGNSFSGPQGGWRISADDAKKIAQAEGLSFQRSLDAGESHYGLIFVKP
jgi:SAM-dependent methyltransferase